MLDGLPDVSQNQLVVAGAIVLVLILAVATGFEKGLGPLGRAVYRIVQDWRDASAAREAGDIAAMRRQIVNLTNTAEALQETVSAVQSRSARLEAYIVESSRWSFQVQRIAAEHEWELPPYPELSI
jgi:hypothetical protein